MPHFSQVKLMNQQLFGNMNRPASIAQQFRQVCEQINKINHSVDPSI